MIAELIETGSSKSLQQAANEIYRDAFNCEPRAFTSYREMTYIGGRTETTFMINWYVPGDPSWAGPQWVSGASQEEALQKMRTKLSDTINATAGYDRISLGC